MATPNRPVVLPETYSGEGTWRQWECHFENVAAVNEWNAASKLLWLKVRLVGRAQTAFQRLPETTKADYKESMKALKKRFEPAGRQARYQAEFQSRKKKATEGWAEYAEDLEALVEKAFPDMGQDGREQIGLTKYLEQLENPQVAFGVKQRQPKTLDDAVSATLELESYVTTKTGKPDNFGVAAVAREEDREALEVTTVGPRQTPTDPSVVQMMQQLIERMDRLESRRQERPTAEAPRLAGPRNNVGIRRGSLPTCWKCGRVGHLQRDCRSRERQPQGN